MIPGLTIALLGVIANTLFWRKYTKLNRQNPNPILAVQARLYRAKSLVDGCVTIALTAVALFPASAAAVWLEQLWLQCISCTAVLKPSGKAKL